MVPEKMVALGIETIDAVIGQDVGAEQADLAHRAHHIRDLDLVIDAEGAQEQQHHAGGHIRQRALQRQADGEAGGAQQRDQRGGLHPELAQHRHHGDGENGIAHAT